MKLKQLKQALFLARNHGYLYVDTFQDKFLNTC